MAWFPQWNGYCNAVRATNGVALTARPMMDPKLALLFVLIAGVIALSHLTTENLDRLRRQLAGRNWREFVPSRRRA